VALDALITELAKRDTLTGLKAKRARAAAGLRTSAAHARWEEIQLSDVKPVIEFTKELMAAHLESPGPRWVRRRANGTLPAGMREIGRVGLPHPGGDATARSEWQLTTSVIGAPPGQSARPDPLIKRQPHPDTITQGSSRGCRSRTA
jgi:hypothetical protein